MLVVMRKIFILTICSCSIAFSQPISTPRHVFPSINHEISNHPGNYPFPTDMTFRKFADHAVDQGTESFDPDVVQRGDTIYLADWYIPWFTKYVHPKIKHPYILISNDSDAWHPESGIWDYDEKYGWSPPVSAIRTLLYDEKVAAWFCKNMVMSRHPKIFQIPIGQSIIYWGRSYFHQNYFTSLVNGEKEKKHLMYMCMRIANNPIRDRVIKLFQDQDFCHSTRTDGTVDRHEYFENLSQSAFTPAPPGYGPDIVRLWEAVVLDCIPILKHSDLDDLYADLPVLFVDDWEEVNEAFLKAKYKEIKAAGFKTDKAYFDHWANLMTQVQEQVRRGSNQFSKLEATSFEPYTFENLSNILVEFSNKKDCLLCKGAILGLRPFQIAKKFARVLRVFTHDQWGAWGHETAAKHLTQFSNNPLFRFEKSIVPLNYYEDPYEKIAIGFKSKTHVFFDLSYRRHTLPDDFENSYQKVSKGSLICGNMFDDSFVKQVLQKFEKKYNIKIFGRGDVWYLIK